MGAQITDIAAGCIVSLSNQTFPARLFYLQVTLTQMNPGRHRQNPVSGSSSFHVLLPGDIILKVINYFTPENVLTAESYPKLSGYNNAKNTRIQYSSAATDQSVLSYFNQ